MFLFWQKITINFFYTQKTYKVRKYHHDFRNGANWENVHSYSNCHRGTCKVTKIISNQKSPKFVLIIDQKFARNYFHPKDWHQSWHLNWHFLPNLAIFYPILHFQPNLALSTKLCQIFAILDICCHPKIPPKCCKKCQKKRYLADDQDQRDIMNLLELVGTC